MGRRQRKCLLFGTLSGLAGAGGPALTARIAEWFDRVHPDELEPLQRAVEEHRRGESERFEHVHRLRRHDGSYVWVAAGGLMARDEQGEPVRMTGWLSDVTEQRRSEAQLRRLALQDALTGLPNRVLFMDRLEQAHERARRRQREYAVLLVDLDRFKVINDSFGHAMGDLLLMKVARILRDTVRPGDTIARLGGDEFVILLEDLERPEQADEIANEVLSTLVQPVEVDGHRVVVGASVGMSRGGGREAPRPEEILREADIAMYKAKSMGGERVDVFDPNAQSNLAERLDLENELRRALDGETLHVHYQPIVDVEHGVVVGFEALARWHHPRLGPVSPGKFIPIAEESGLIDRLGECVLRVACRDAAKLKRSFPDASPFRMGVNLSVAQLAHTDLCERVARALCDSELTADYLSLEITESGLLEDTDGAVRIFSELQAMGVRLSMDDFGTGYSSLQYLRRFRIDTLKNRRLLRARHGTRRGRGDLRHHHQPGQGPGLECGRRGRGASRRAPALASPRWPLRAGLLALASAALRAALCLAREHAGLAHEDGELRRLRLAVAPDLFAFGFHDHVRVVARPVPHLRWAAGARSGRSVRHGAWVGRARRRAAAVREEGVARAAEGRIQSVGPHIPARDLLSR